jgi:hypothetical protein
MTDEELTETLWGGEITLGIVAAAADRIEALAAELDLMKTAGVIEIASRNNRVTEYMLHWEGRALDAEAKLAKAVAALRAIKEEAQYDTAWSIACGVLEIMEEAE